MDMPCFLISMVLVLLLLMLLYPLLSGYTLPIVFMIIGRMEPRDGWFLLKKLTW